jgi:hypothetical protein
LTGLNLSPSMCGLEFTMVTCLTIFPFGEITKSTALPLVKKLPVLAPNVGTIDLAVGADGETFDAACSGGQNGQHLDVATVPCASRCRRENS